MLRYIAHRMLLLVPTLFGISLVVFLLIQFIPGDAVDMLLGTRATPESAAALRQTYGLDQSVVGQYVNWIGNVLRGDLGYSIRTGQPVGELILGRSVVSAELAILGVLLAVLVGAPLGLLAAARQNGPVDYAASTVALLGLSTPDYWLATLLVLLFSVTLRWLPPSGYVPFAEDPVRNLQLMALPAITVAAGSASYIMRMTRSVTLEILSQEYVRTAAAKGLSYRRIVLHHTLRNALVPILAVIGLQIGYLLGSVVIVESIFAVPGLGRTALESIYARDYPVVMAAVMAIALWVVLANLLTDLLSAYADPRILDQFLARRT